MHSLFKSRCVCLRLWTVVLLLTFASISHAPAFTTGVPFQFTIDPATARQKDKPTSDITATVVLKTPAPTVFVCSLRTTNRYKVSFPDIVFRKGQLEGICRGTVNWANIPKDCAIKVSAFSVDDPGTKLWFTVTLKPADETKPVDVLNR